MTATGLPIFLSNCPSERSDQILWLIKKSELNFCVQETTFSLNIQLKKKFVTKWENNRSSPHSPSFSQPNGYQNMANNFVDKSTLEEEMKVEVDSLKAENDAKMDTIRTLEVKLEKYPQQSLQGKYSSFQCF